MGGCGRVWVVVGIYIYIICLFFLGQTKRSTGAIFQKSTAYGAVVMPAAHISPCVQPAFRLVG